MAKKKNDIIDLQNIDFSNLTFDVEAKDKAKEVEQDRLFTKEFYEDFEFNARYIKPTKTFFKTTAIKHENAKKLAAEIKPTAGFRYDVLVSGSFIFGDFIHAFMTAHHLQAKRCIISTLGMNEANVDALAALLRANYILDLELFVSVYFFSLKRHDIVPYIYRTLDAEEFRGRFQLSVSHIHTKTFQIETTEGRKMIMQGSANLCSSANIEQFIFEENPEVYDFYEGIFNKFSNKYFNKLKASIQQDPEMLELREIIAYEHEGKFICIGGNMRFEALKALGYTTAKCKVISECDTEQLKRIILKDNSAYGEWDFDELANEWDEALIRACAIEIPTMDEAKMEEEAEEDNFNPDDIEQEPTVKRGDIWQLGNHRLLCGDSTKAEDVAKLMQGEKADLWLTDPPYNVDYSSKNDYLNKVDKGCRVQAAIENDKMSDADFRNFLHNAFSAANNVMRAGCPFYVWTTQGHAMTDIMRELDNVGLFFRQQLIWVKNNLVLGRMDYQGRHEPCLYGWKEGAHYFVNSRNHTTVYEDGEEIDIDKLKKDEMNKLLHDILDSKTPESVIRCPKPQKSADHPTMKPVRLFGYQIANSSRPGNIILDTFGGSGTTIVAAEQLNRRARLMELDPHYCDVIIARWEKLTGRQAVKIGNLP